MLRVVMAALGAVLISTAAVQAQTASAPVDTDAKITEQAQATTPPKRTGSHPYVPRNEIAGPHNGSIYGFPKGRS